MVSEEQVAFIESGLSVLIGSRDEKMVPTAMRGCGVKVHADRKSLTLFVPDETGPRTLANLRANGRIAMTFTRPLDHRSLQLKGRATSFRASTEEERPFLEAYVEAWARHLEGAGMPYALGSRLTYWPSTAVEVVVEASFHQTPGPSAGTRIAESR